MRLVIAWVGASVAMMSLLADASAATTVSRASDGMVELVTQIDRQSALVVEPIEVTLTLTAPMGTKVTLPQPMSQLGAFQVQRVNTVTDVPDRLAADMRTWTVTIVLDTLESGELSIPMLDVQYRLPDADAFQSLSSQPIEIQIVSQLEDRVDPTDFRDVKPVVDVAEPTAASRAWIAWLAGAIGIVLVVATCVVVGSRRRRVISPGDWALSQISQLESTIDAEPATADSVYGELTMIIHDFIGMQYGDFVVRSTDQASLDGPVGDWRVPKSRRTGLCEIMSLADEVKFARRSVSETQVRQSIQQARKWVVACGEEMSLDAKGAA
jgi:hypothetical protein